MDKCDDKWQSIIKKRHVWGFFPQAVMALFILTDVAATFRWSGNSGSAHRSFDEEHLPSEFIQINFF